MIREHLRSDSGVIPERLRIVSALARARNREGKGTGKGKEGIFPPDVSLSLNKRSARDASGQAEAQVMSA